MVITMIIIMTFLCRALRAPRSAQDGLSGHSPLNVLVASAAADFFRTRRGVEFAVRSPGSERDGHGDHMGNSYSYTLNIH